MAKANQVNQLDTLSTDHKWVVGGKNNKVAYPKIRITGHSCDTCVQAKQANTQEVHKPRCHTSCGILHIQSNQPATRQAQIIKHIFVIFVQPTGTQNAIGCCAGPQDRVT